MNLSLRKRCRRKLSFALGPYAFGSVALKIFAFGSCVFEAFAFGRFAFGDFIFGSFFGSLAFGSFGRRCLELQTLLREAVYGSRAGAWDPSVTSSARL